MGTSSVTSLSTNSNEISQHTTIVETVGASQFEYSALFYAVYQTTMLNDKITFCQNIALTFLSTFILI